MIGGAHLSAGCQVGRRRPEAGALSYDGGRNRAGHWQHVGLLGWVRKAAAREGVGWRGGLG
jgi:hypothetical protein